MLIITYITSDRREFVFTCTIICLISDIWFCKAVTDFSASAICISNLDIRDTDELEITISKPMTYKSGLYSPAVHVHVYYFPLYKILNT